MSEMKQTEMPSVSPYLVIGVGILAVSTSAILIRWAQAEEVSSIVISAWRTAVATLIFLPLAWRNHDDELRQMSGQQWGLAALAGVFLGMHFASWITSLEYTSVTSSTVLVTTTPIWVGVASPLFLGERMTRPLRWGIVLSIIGSLIITFGDAWAGGDTADLGGDALWGNFLALLGALTIAGYMIIGRRLRARLSLLSYTSVVYGSAAVVLLLFAVIRGLPLFGYSPYVYLLLVLMALIPQVLGHTSFNWALRFLPAAFVSVTVLGEPIGASILAILILGELPLSPVTAVIGALLIFCGILVASRPE